MENFINSLLDDTQGGAGTAIILIIGLITLFVITIIKSCLKDIISENLKPFINRKIEAYKQIQQQRKIRQAYDTIQVDIINQKIILSNAEWTALTQHYMK